MYRGEERKKKQYKKPKIGGPKRTHKKKGMMPKISPTIFKLKKSKPINFGVNKLRIPKKKLTFMQAKFRYPRLKPAQDIIFGENDYDED